MGKVKLGTEVGKLKNWVGAVVSLNEEANLQFSQEGIKVCVLDPHQIAAVYLTINKEQIERYQCEEPRIVGVSIKQLYDQLKTLKNKQEYVTVEVFEQNITVKTENKEFELPVLEIGLGLQKELQINTTVKLTGKNGDMLTAIKDCSTISPYIKIEGIDKAVIFSSENIETSAKIKHIFNSGCVESTKDAYLVVSAEYLTKICKGIGKKDEVITSIGGITSEDPRPKPLQIESNIDRAKVKYFLAPRIEEGD